AVIPAAAAATAAAKIVVKVAAPTPIAMPSSVFHERLPNPEPEAKPPHRHHRQILSTGKT
ncbi:MAG TPA: hypothetical protein VG308_20785, partial [Stellaceae bacterium]|nr:hypothetical protein [Stellaceae bacterium]